MLVKTPTTKSRQTDSLNCGVVVRGEDITETVELTPKQFWQAILNIVRSGDYPKTKISPSTEIDTDKLTMGDFYIHSIIGRTPISQSGTAVEILQQTEDGNEVFSLMLLDGSMDRSLITFVR